MHELSPPPFLPDFDPVPLLQWYREAGVTCGVEESATDFYQLSARQARERAEAARIVPPARVKTPVPGPFPSPLSSSPGGGAAARSIGVQSEARRDASQLAGAAGTLEDLKTALDGFSACPLRKTATNTVFADGDPASGLMIIGEAPGAEEDRLGLPFVGASGRLLDAMLASIGLDRRTCYITNVVPWRPPGNRKPTPDELALCVPFLERHIALVDPRFILAVGGLAAQTLLARTEGITRLRGQWGAFSLPDLPRPVPVLATFHPAYLLRTPEQKRFAWRDLLAFRHRAEEERSGAPSGLS